ncbi:hypothetical protein SAMN02745945_00833 [Peptoclostridium litorale DSM 5388]|uniref:UPF0122 protein CLIT_23c04220 n=1 Tax=Peptoclostridium litorale DSM 5388 TaxID=1121324 RepID=A0A069RAS8_PEPLI|nr:putative DNA-binding protein [Peptoclostridium litorale]KDR94149.1 helix-turn-helix protein, YlxM/p13 family [Peptoclostridium litorale DSM 5388]SIN81490.1 hypothetical protein SAMN02745945_00833 [Peptoclostridium litorale DSM 5388]
MDLNKLVELSILFDYYGELLTSKQRDVVSLYYDEDYSLSEISENLGISRQAVYDTLKRAEKILKGYEEKLGLVEMLDNKNNGIRAICEGLENIQAKAQKCQTEELEQDIQKLMNHCRELLK